MATFVRQWKRKRSICIIKCNRDYPHRKRFLGSRKKAARPTFLSDTVNKLHFITIVNNKVGTERVHPNCPFFVVGGKFKMPYGLEKPMNCCPSH